MVVLSIAGFWLALVVIIMLLMRPFRRRAAPVSMKSVPAEPLDRMSPFLIWGAPKPESHPMAWVRSSFSPEPIAPEPIKPAAMPKVVGIGCRGRDLDDFFEGSRDWTIVQQAVALRALDRIYRARDRRKSA